MILMFNEVQEFKNNNLTQKYSDDLGYDVRAGESGVVYPGCSSGFIYTGLHIHIPNIMGATLETRSNQIEQNVMTDGTIDSGYHGAVGLKLYNFDNARAYEWEKGDRIAQMVFHVRPEGLLNMLHESFYQEHMGWMPEVFNFTIKEKDISKWPKTERARNGFGSTGVR